MSSVVCRSSNEHLPWPYCGTCTLGNMRNRLTDNNLTFDTDCSFHLSVVIRASSCKLDLWSFVDTSTETLSLFTRLSIVIHALALFDKEKSSLEQWHVRQCQWQHAILTTLWLVYKTTDRHRRIVSFPSCAHTEDRKSTDMPQKLK